MADHLVDSRLRIAEMLHEILSAGRVVILSMDDDALYHGNAGGQPSRRSVATSLEGCVEGLTDEPRTKVCSRADCLSRGVAKLLWCFGPDKDSADGHAAVCKACEAKRIGALARRKKDGPIGA